MNNKPNNAEISKNDALLQQDDLAQSAMGTEITTSIYGTKYGDSKKLMIILGKNADRDLPKSKKLTVNNCLEEIEARIKGNEWLRSDEVIDKDNIAISKSAADLKSLPVGLVFVITEINNRINTKMLQA